MKSTSIIGKIASILVLIGAINWGLVGLFHLDLVQRLFGSSLVATVVYIAVGVAGVWKLVTCLGCCKTSNL